MNYLYIYLFCIIEGLELTVFVFFWVLCTCILAWGRVFPFRKEIFGKIQRDIRGSFSWFGYNLKELAYLVIWIVTFQRLKSLENQIEFTFFVLKKIFPFKWDLSYQSASLLRSITEIDWVYVWTRYKMKQSKNIDAFKLNIKASISCWLTAFLNFSCSWNIVHDGFALENRRLYLLEEPLL